MAKLFVGGISSNSILAGGFVSLVLLAGAGFTGWTMRPDHPTDIVVSPVDGEPGLSAAPDDVITWKSTDNGSVAVSFNGGYIPCKDKNKTNPCKLSPKHDGDLYDYSCEITKADGSKIACTDPRLGPVSASATFQGFDFIDKVASKDLINLADGSAYRKHQVECDDQDKNPVLYSPSASQPKKPVDSTNPVNAKLNDKLTWTNSAGTALLVPAGKLNGFSCTETADTDGSYASTGCTIHSGTGLVSYTIQGCQGDGTHPGSTTGYVKLP